ncbi:hypothetical protein CTI12_AA552670 [Artemisia annua]|uniref:Helitron helicase-like domain-containing protein n=1 Tax=Artemisia annua TaxID=35608 RepID=A0A2U1KXE4_ARTAN|nr:hypothetical protein CTI12_AA552670 [Artemisia annua]
MQAVSNGPSTSSNTNELDHKLTTDIRDMLDSINPLVKEFRMAGERIRTKDDQSLKLKLIGTRARDGRDYNLPTASEVAALIVGDFDETKNKRNIILHRQDGDLKRISELHPSYLAMQYPLLFPYADNDVLSVTTNASAPQMMKTLAKCYFGVIEKDLVSKYSLSPRQVVILNCIRALHAQDFLFTIPIDGLGQRMNHRQFRSVLCYRLTVHMFSEVSLLPEL